MHRSYDSLQYPLMFPYGEYGYSINISQVDPVTRVPTQKRVSCMNYCYHIMVRHNNSNHLLRYGILFNQYIVDQYAKIEFESLAFIRHNLKDITS